MNRVRGMKSNLLSEALAHAGDEGAAVHEGVAGDAVAEGHGGVRADQVRRAVHCVTVGDDAY